MKTPLLLLLLAVCLRAAAQTNSSPQAASSGHDVETIVCIRHGEKPHGGLGQLTCRGLNRSLALPDVLLAKFGKPQFIFAPNPAEKSDGLPGYNYIRPLATIEPTAIRCGLPVNTEYGFTQITRLERELGKPEYRNATVFVAWEHALLDVFVKDLVQAGGGNQAQVPNWPEKDFDTIFVVKITYSQGRPSTAFAIDHEGLNGLSDTCPQPARAK